MSKSKFDFRPAGAADQAALAALMFEANRHYWGHVEGAEDMTMTAADALISGRSGCQAILAWQAQTALGFATVSLLHPAPSAHGTLFMKDLFISKAARGTGLGDLFMRHLARWAVELGCQRFDWTAETDNPRAIAFYERLGASRVAEKVYFRFDAAALKDMAGPDTP